MSFYPCRGGGKSPLNKEFQVTGCSYIANIRNTPVVTINITDADFIVIVSFLKSATIGNNFTFSGTNQCVCILGKVGDTVIVYGAADFMNKELTIGGKCMATWESSNTLIVKKVEGSNYLDGSVGIFYCKYI